MKKSLLIVVSLLLIMSVVAGCSTDDKSAKEIVLENIQNQAQLNSAEFNGNIKFGFDFSNINASSQEIAMMQMISGVEFAMDGKTQQEPMQFEMNMNTKADMSGTSFAIDLPMLMKDNTLYMKMPGQLLGYMPDPSKEYISVDMTEAYSNYDAQNAKEEYIEIYKAIINSLEDNAYTKENTKDYSIDSGKISDVVSVTITQENIKPFLKNIMNDALPLMLEQFGEYSLEEQKAQFEEIKAEIEKNKDNINQYIDDLDKYVKINNFKMTSVYDNDGFERKTMMDLDITIMAEEIGELGLTMNIEFNTNSINEDITFEMEVPDKDNVMDSKALEEMGAGF